jgi:uncharacterized protein (DUF2236 family)
MNDRLEASDIVFRFLQIMRDTPAFPKPFQWMQQIMVRAAVDIVPDSIRNVLGLDESYGLRLRDRWLVKMAANTADRIVLKESPAAQSCLRLGLPVTYLYDVAASRRRTRVPPPDM